MGSNRPDYFEDCPRCRSDKGVVQLLFGLPDLKEPVLSGELDRGEVALGGCVVDECFSNLQCNACGHRWRSSLSGPNPLDPSWVPCSHKFEQASVQVAQFDLHVPYGGGVVEIPKGSTYYTDNAGAVLVGWHGSFDPPHGMDFESMLDE